MTKQLTFYTNPMSRGQIVRWMLEEAGAEYAQVIVEYGPQMKAADYLTINPMGKVPTIVHGNKVVTECAAICAYLADVFPEAGLAPPVDQRGDYYRWLFFAAGPLESAVFNERAGFEVSEKQQQMIGYGNYQLTLNAIDLLLGESDNVCGDSFTAADVYLGSQIDWGLTFKTITPTANFEAYADRMRARPAYKKAKAIDAALMPEDK